MKEIRLDFDDYKIIGEDRYRRKIKKYSNIIGIMCLTFLILFISPFILLDKEQTYKSDQGDTVVIQHNNSTLNGEQLKRTNCKDCNWPSNQLPSTLSIIGLIGSIICLIALFYIAYKISAATKKFIREVYNESEREIE